MFEDAPGDGDNQVYAEIRDQDTTTPSTTQPQDVTVATGTVHTSHQYEDVSDVTRAGGDYQITLCAAYGYN